MPPAMRTGELRQSYKVLEDSAGGVTFGSDKKYAPFLEFGTRRMRPRPHVRPVVKEMQVRANEVIAAAIIRRQRETVARWGGRR
jgi:HK97 gp10 family phage protein